jgi:hypothetical protein
MSGYTPLYDHTLSGTLYGRWPHTGIWTCLLSRASREGVIDEVPASLAAAIGVPVEMLMQCIHDFMQPDPGSRTKDHDGRRLELLDPGREWGWRVVNHGKYREKARKRNYDEQRTSSGSDAERKKKERESREVPTCPAKSREVPLSDAEADSSKKERATRLPADFGLTPSRTSVTTGQRRLERKGKSSIGKRPGVSGAVTTKAQTKTIQQRSGETSHEDVRRLPH